MGISFVCLVVIALVFVVYLGIEVAGLHLLFGIIIPYLALATFIVGFSYRVLHWAKIPVPFCIPTTCGQQKSLSWIKPASLDNPFTTFGVIGRMALEILLFRSLFRNTQAELTGDKQLVYHWEKWLWLSAMVFHWSILIVVIRHLRFFFEPVPNFLLGLQWLDGFFLIGLQAVYASGLLLLAAVTYLLIRRLVVPEMRYISLAADYFPLAVIISIAATGLIMRYVARVDVVATKSLILGLVSFHPVIPAGISWLVYLHLLMVSLLIAYFPFSKLTHMAGIFLSPTRNLVNNSRAVRHVNPWNNPVPVHTYEEYVAEYKDKMTGAGLPL
jgi:nitrate reductase gamma subunit